jgi:hypothetical protein
MDKFVRLCIEYTDLFLLYVFMVFSKDIFSAIYGLHKRFCPHSEKGFCPHSVSRILLMHIPAPNRNLFASKSIPTKFV